MSEKMVTLGTFLNAAEAGLVRAELELMGIRAALLGEGITTVLGGMGLSYVQLLVSEAHVECALDLLYPRGDLEAAEESVEEESSSPSTGIRAERESLHQTPPTEVGREEEENSITPPEKLPDPGLPTELREDVLAEEGLLVFSADDRATRAFRSALYGLLIFRLVFHLYSLWILIGLRSYCAACPGKEPSVLGKWKAYGALAIDLASLLPLLFILIFFEWTWYRYLAESLRPWFF